MKKNSIQLKDVVMMAVLGILFAAVYMGMFYAGMALQGVLTPAGLGNFAFEAVYGSWFMAATIAAYIIRKPGVALITEVLAAGLELLMGNSGGVTVVLTGLIQGAGCELAFAMFRYKRFDLLSMTLSGVFAAIFIFVYELYYLQYYLLSPGILAAQLAVRFVSAFIFAGLISKIACDGLAATGVLKNYAAGASRREIAIEEEEE